MRRALAVLGTAAALVGITAAADPTTTPATTTAEAAPPPAAPPTVWTFGDSITAGTWLADPPTQSWPAQLDALLGPGQQVRNLGVGGQAVAYADPGGERMDAYVLRMLASVPASERPSLVLFAGGINDMIWAGDVTATRTAVFNLGNTVQGRYPGVTFRPLTITPYRSDAGYADPLSGRRSSYNAWARAQYGPWLIDAGDVLTAGATYADPRYYLDPLHPNAAGARELAQAVYVRLEGQRTPCC